MISRLPKRVPFTKLKRNYILHFETGLILSLALLISLFHLYLPSASNSLSFNFNTDEITFFEGVILTMHKPEAPPTPRIPVEKPQDFIIEEELTGTEQNLRLPDPIAAPPTLQNIRPDRLSRENFTGANEEMPQLLDRITQLQERIKYPKKAVRDRITGRVVIQFIIDREGKVRDPEVIKGLRRDVDREAVKALKKTRFIPAKRNGRPIVSQTVIFIRFKIED